MATKKQEQLQIFDKLIQLSIRNLTTSGCAFKVMSPDGTLYENNADLFEKKPKVKRHNLNYGGLRAIYLPKVQSLDPGEAAVVPVPEDVHPHAIQSGVCAWASSNWGMGKYTTHCNMDNHTVEVLRLE